MGADGRVHPVSACDLACQALVLHPGVEHSRGQPRTLDADNETFIRARDSKLAYCDENITITSKMPPRSPDLNPIEKFWAWFRRALRHKDLDDLKNKRPRLGKMAYKARVRAVAKSAKAQQVASNCYMGLRKVCREVVKKKGAASRS